MPTTVNSIKLNYLTSAAEKFSFTLNYADPALTEEGGAEIVTAAANAMITQQPFNVQLASFTGADFIDKTTTVIV